MNIVRSFVQRHSHVKDNLIVLAGWRTRDTTTYLHLLTSGTNDLSHSTSEVCVKYECLACPCQKDHEIQEPSKAPTALPAPSAQNVLSPSEFASQQ